MKDQLMVMALFENTKAELVDHLAQEPYTLSSKNWSSKVLSPVKISLLASALDVNTVLLEGEIGQ
jgi:hypothetical protein